MRTVTIAATATIKRATTSSNQSLRRAGAGGAEPIAPVAGGADCPGGPAAFPDRTGEGGSDGGAVTSGGVSGVEMLFSFAVIEYPNLQPNKRSFVSNPSLDPPRGAPLRRRVITESCVS
jgi:hypothetical protein